MATKCKYNVGDKVRIKRGRYIGKVGQIIVIEPRRLYGRRTFKVAGSNWSDIYVSYEMELLSPINYEELEKEIDKNIKTTKTKIVLEFDHDPFAGIDSKTAQHLKQTASKITVDETILKNRYGESDVKAKTITVTLSEAQKMYKLGGTYRDLALKLFTEDELNPKPQVPHSWEEYCKDFYPYENHMHYTPEFVHGFVKEDCNALIAYGRLIRLRKAWIKDWEPDYVNNTLGNHWVIEYDMKPKYKEQGKGPKVVNLGFMYRIVPLTFPTEEMATEFIKSFGDLLEKAKGLY